ncbi:MAG: hypothetical protein NVS2B6_05690 [Thermoleophilaceae bacterium]
MAPATRWSTTPYEFSRAHRLAEALGLSSAMASILVMRGYGDPTAAARFLAADERHDAAAFGGIEIACGLILDHLEHGSRIVVHFDYDGDGVGSTAVVIRALRELGASPRWHLPARADGYGLSAATVARLSREGARLLITADCAITAVAEVDAAKALGLDVIVTDHHRPGERLPDCPIVHPTVCGYPFADLCAAGVAHKLALALFERAQRSPDALEHDLDLVGLATIADVVPLHGENRRLVRSGLEALSRTSKPGLRALMSVAGVEAGAVDEHAVGYRLAPRLNAAGRLQRADAALELVLTDDGERADQIADELDLLNRERRDAETRILFAAEAARANQADAAAYVLAGEDWHPGVIGIVAGRIAERYHRPCVVIALAGELGRGSARSIPAYDLHAGLGACADYLLRFGGHRAAAGLEIARDRVEDLRAALAEHAASELTIEDLTPEERVDAVISADSVGIALAEELQRLAPFGHGNPRPTLLVPAARVEDVCAMGDESQHARFTLAGGAGRARAVAFRTSPRSLTQAGAAPHDAAVRLELNEWRGAVEPRLVLRALCPTVPGAVTVAGPDEPFWTVFHRELRAPLAAPSGPPAPEYSDEPYSRVVCDRRGSGFAGTAGDLIAGGEPVLIICADAARRLSAIERLLAGVGVNPPVLAEWATLLANPSIAMPYVHLIALDPPTSEQESQILTRAPCSSGRGFAHLAWGEAETHFARARAVRTLDLREELGLLYRDLRSAGRCTGPALEAALRGGGRYPRDPRLCGRLMRVLLELDLADYDADAENPSCSLRAAERTELERSATYRDCLGRLALAEQAIDGSLPRAA